MVYQLCLLAGMMAVASNPSPYFGAFGLVWGAGVGCFILVEDAGGSFVSLLLFLIYLGGMMVVFAYSAALVAEPYPEAWGNMDVLKYLIFYSLLAGLLGVWTGVEDPIKFHEYNMINKDWCGMSNMFGTGGLLLFFLGWSMFLTLLGVLEIVRGHFSGVLRVV
uniref:NADH-ubiquinone oxidoreductase chain 6 n=1 Tax=Arthroleptis poecilonotus TaxID=577105 RepID=S4V208_ARTPO|nr:NADH dehydrogenase subunit 6 [Arthroleptis poecilonotus]